MVEVYRDAIEKQRAGIAVNREVSEPLTPGAAC